MRDIRLSKSCLTFSKAGGATYLHPTPTSTSTIRGGKSHSHGLPKRARDVPNPFNRAPNPPRTNHPIPSHPIPPPIPPFSQPTLSRNPPPQNPKPPRTKGFFFQNITTLSTQKIPPSTRNLISGRLSGLHIYISQSMHAFACAALPPAVSSTEPPRGGRCERALLRGALWGIWKALGGAFMACGLSLQLRGAGVMRGSGISACDVNSAPRRRRRCRRRYGGIVVERFGVRREGCGIHR